MPETATDLASLTLRLKALSGDLDRQVERTTDGFKEVHGAVDNVIARVEQLSGQMEQLRGHVDTLKVTRKTTVRFDAALDGNWVGGTRNGRVTLAQGEEKSIAAGFMLVVLPNLSRISGFRALVQIRDGQQFPEFLDRPNSRLLVTLERMDARSFPLGEFGFFGAQREPAFETLLLPTSGLLPGRGDPIPGKDLVDNELHAHVVFAHYSARNNTSQSVITIPEGMVVVEGFEVDCLVA